MTELDLDQRHSFNFLPDDILLQVLFFLESDDVLSLSLVCRKFHELSNCFVVWHNLFLNLLHRARYIDLLAIDQKPLESANVDDLKHPVVQASSAEKNWLHERPKVKGPPKMIDLKRAFRNDISLKQSVYITKFTSRHLLVPFIGGTVAGWDLKKNRPAGSYDMEPDSMMVDLALDKSAHALVCLTARFAPVRLDHSFGMHVGLGALRIGVPEPDSAGPLLFERSKQIILLLPLFSELHLLDASRRMLCAAFCIHQSTEMGILVVFDWETENAAIINTGIPYDYGRSLIGVHVSQSAEFLIVVSESEGSEVRRWYRLADLNPSPSIWNAVEHAPGPPVTPEKQRVFRWTSEPAVLSKSAGTSSYVYWSIDQLPEPPYPEVPARVSTVVLYFTNQESVQDTAPFNRIWTVAQYYSDEKGPCSPSRSILTIRNPVPCPNEPAEDGMPIVCLSFNHFGWIEEVEVDGVSRRVVKLVTFPDPGSTYDGDLADTARTLDIPSDLLETAYHILLDSTQGLIIVATDMQSLHVYRY